MKDKEITQELLSEALELFGKIEAIFENLRKLLEKTKYNDLLLSFGEEITNFKFRIINDSDEIDGKTPSKEIIKKSLDLLGELNGHYDELSKLFENTKHSEFVSQFEEKISNVRDTILDSN